MNGKMYASDLMTRQVRSVSVQGTLAEALQIMDEHGYGQIPVVDGDRPVRLLTERDARLALRDGKIDHPAAELASPLPCLLLPEAPLSEVVEALQDRDSLLICDDQGALVGIITYWDVLRVARPHLLVAEAELLLRKVVADEYREKFGSNWWGKVRPDLRDKAEEEHQRDARGRKDQASSEHMLGHTSFWTLIEIFREIRRDIPEEQLDAFQKVRVWRNQVAHLYLLSEEDLAKLVRETLAMRDFLEAPPAPACPG